MKLLCCHECGDVRALRVERIVTCECGKAAGAYESDGLNAKVTGPKDKFSVLGFHNSTLNAAVLDQIRKGDLPKTLYYGGEFVSPGREFKAFIIPDSAPSVKIVHS